LIETTKGRSRALFSFVRMKGRLVLGALLLAYVPVFAFVAVVATPAYATFPQLSIFAAPAALAALGLALLLSPRAARVMAWLAVAVLGLWLAENVASIVWYLAQWEMQQGLEPLPALLRALGQCGSRAPYWLAALLPICAAAAQLRFSKP
jgi:hypothetical protein